MINMCLTDYILVFGRAHRIRRLDTVNVCDFSGYFFRLELAFSLSSCGPLCCSFTDHFIRLILAHFNYLN